MSVISTKETAFDPTVSFMFFGSWVQTIENLEPFGVEHAYRLFKAIAAYCMYDEDPDFSDDYALNAIWPMLRTEANSSITRRRSQFKKDELNDNYHKILDALQANPGFSHRQIAEMVGVSPSTVDRVCRKYPVGIRDSSAHPVPASFSGCDISSGDRVTDSSYIGYSDSGIDHAIVNGNAIDTMTQGSDAHKETIDAIIDEASKYISLERYTDPRYLGQKPMTSLKRGAVEKAVSGRRE